MFGREFFGAAYYQPNYWIGGTGTAPEAPAVGGSVRRQRAYRRLLALRQRQLDRLEGEKAAIQAKLTASRAAVPGKRKWATLGDDALPALDRVRLQSELMQLANRIAMQRALIAGMRAAFEEQDEEDALMLIL